MKYLFSILLFSIGISASENPSNVPHCDFHYEPYDSSRYTIHPEFSEEVNKLIHGHITLDEFRERTEHIRKEYGDRALVLRNKKQEFICHVLNVISLTGAMLASCVIVDIIEKRFFNK